MRRRLFLSAAVAATPLAAQNALTQAAQSGDAAAVRAIVQADRAQLYARNEHGESVYLLACYAAQPAVAAELLRLGLKLDFHEMVAGAQWQAADRALRANTGLAMVRNPRGDTPAHVAVLAGRPEYFQRFIIHPQNLNAPSDGRHGATPVHLAAGSPDHKLGLAMLQQMLGNGAVAASLDAKGESPLAWALRAGNTEGARLLARKGAPAAGPATLPEGPRDRQASRYRFRRDHSPFEPPPPETLPAAFVNQFVVLCHFNRERVEAMLRLCPGLALHKATFEEMGVEAAAHTDNRAIAALLLDKGAPYSLPTAVMFGDEAGVKRMLDDDPLRVFERGPHDFPLAFYPAFGDGSVTLMETLKSRGMNVAESVLQRSALHVAAEFGHRDLARYLLEQGLDPRHKGVTLRGAMTPLELAVAAKNEAVTALLREWEAKRL